ncbi:MAG TPA: hypothetical protein VEN81_05600, partial [Planctomycetota bacterium]|nr:hypothetical protein [Planctomycetota bacterium]
MTLKRLVALSGFALGIGPTAWAQEDLSLPPQVRLEGDAEYLRSSGWLFITRGSEPGSATRIHERREFGMDSETVPAGQAIVRLFDEHALGFRVVSMDENGTRSSPDDFIYHGTLYPAGREVLADVGFLLAGADYQYHWRPNSFLELTPHLGFEYWGFSSRLKTVDAGPPIRESRSFSSGYWLSGMDLGATLQEGLEAGISLLGGVDGADRNFLELRGGIRARLAASIALSVD